MANGTELETNKNICVGFFVTQISQMTQIFFIIGRHGISRRRPVRSLQISPWDWTKRFIRDSIKNLWKSVKSVGQKNNEKENQDNYFFLVLKRIYKSRNCPGATPNFKSRSKSAYASCFLPNLTSKST